MDRHSAQQTRLRLIRTLEEATRERDLRPGDPALDAKVFLLMEILLREGISPLETESDPIEPWKAKENHVA